MGSGKAPPPDPNIGIAQREMAAIARSAEERAASSDKFFQENFAPRYLQQMDDNLALSKQQAAKANELQDFQTGLMKKYDARYWDTTAKYQDAFYADVDKFSRDAQEDKFAGRANADVQQAFDNSDAQMQTGLRLRGVDPGSAAAISAMRFGSTDRALAMAGGMNMARRAADEMGWSLKAQAAGLGGNLTGAAAGAAGTAMGAGQAALGAGQAGMGAIGAAQGGFNSNSSNWANTMGLASTNWNGVGGLGVQLSNYNLNAANYNRQGAAGMGRLVGTLVGGSNFGNALFGGGGGGGEGFKGLYNIFKGP